jgi:hypothetical protein
MVLAHLRHALALIASGRASEIAIIAGAQQGFTAAEEAIAGPIADAFLGRRLP